MFQGKLSPCAPHGAVFFFGGSSMAGSATIQICSTEGCGAPAAFTTRTKPAWCEQCIDALFRVGGLVPLEPFISPTAYRRTECLTCGSQMPYRFAYVLDLGLGSYPQAVCRVCHWRKWGKLNRNTHKAELDLDVCAALASPDNLTENERTLLATNEVVRASVQTWWWPTERIRAVVGQLHHDLLFDTGGGSNDGMDPVGLKCRNCGYEHVELPGRLASELAGHWCLCPSCNNRNKGVCTSDVEVGFAARGMLVPEPEKGTDTVQKARCTRCGTPRQVSMRRLNRGIVPCYVCDGAADPSTPHRVYLFHFPAWRAYKVGITNSGNDARLDTHRQAGGRLLEILDVPHRGAALWVEQEVLKAMSPWPATALPVDRIISGWTEMWHEDAAMHVQLSEYREQAEAVTIDRELIEDWTSNRAGTLGGEAAAVASLNPGNTVCFTGSGLDSAREEWEASAKRGGLRVSTTVTARVSALVAPAGGSPGAKAARAAGLGVPVISYESFLAALDEAERA